MRTMISWGDVAAEMNRHVVVRDSRAKSARLEQIWQRWLIRLCAFVACGVLTACGSTDSTPASSSSGAPAVDASLSTTAVTSADTAPDEPLCDRSERLRLRLFYEPRLDREDQGSAVRVENGNMSLAIDGKCQYWINGGWNNGPADRDLGWRTGQIDSSLEQALDRLVDLYQLEKLSDCVAQPETFDGSAYTIRSEYSAARCADTKYSDNRFYEVWGLIDGMELWEQGRPLDGPIHIAAFANGIPDAETFTWPLPNRSPRDFLSGANEPGKSILITDEEDARLLRDLRETYLQRRLAPDAQQAPWPGGIQIEGQIQIFLRDAIPYEQANGLLPFSDPP